MLQLCCCRCCAGARSDARNRTAFLTSWLTLRNPGNDLNILHQPNCMRPKAYTVCNRLTGGGPRSARRDLDSSAQLSQRRGVPQQKLSQMSHPLLGDRPTLQLMPSRTDIAGKMRIHPPSQPRVKFQMKKLSEQTKTLLNTQR